MKPSSPLSLLLVVLGTAACSGEDPAPEATEKQEDPSCQEQSIIDPTLLIDDMEDGDGLLATVGIRNGGWWVSSDGTSTTTPPPDQTPPAERILGGRCQSEYAMHLTGTGFTAWGAVISASFRFLDDVTPFDASMYRGITFWARVGEDNDSPVRAQLQDSSTHPLGDVCNPESMAPDECYNGFGVPLTGIGTEWKKFTLDFSTLAQRDGWGYRAPAVEPTALFNIEWNLDQNRTFDLWIDDVWFYE